MYNHHLEISIPIIIWQILLILILLIIFYLIKRFNVKK